MEASGDAREAKRRLRREHRSARRRRTPEEQARAAERAAHHGSVFASVPCVRSIVGYVASDGELDIEPLLGAHRRAGAHLFLPRVAPDGGLDLVPVGPGTTLEPSGPGGTLQPTGPAIALDSIARPAVLLAPAVALDRRGNRLGRGGGAYDRLLPDARRRGWLVVGVCHADQVVARLPTEPHDEAVDEILTERGWLSPGGPPARSGVVLAGGRSRRMGTPKALLDLHGLPLIAHVARALRTACDEILLSVAAESDAPPPFVEALRRAVLGAGWSSLTVVHDPPDAGDRGPVGGLAAALPRARGEIAFVAACDTPFLAPDLVSEILRRAEEPAAPDLVLPVWEGRDQPLLAAYRIRTMAPHFAMRLATGGGRPTDGLETYSVVRVPEEELRRIDPSGESFVNVNDPEEYRAARARRPARRQPS